MGSSTFLHNCANNRNDYIVFFIDQMYSPLYSGQNTVAAKNTKGKVLKNPSPFDHRSWTNPFQPVAQHKVWCWLCQNEKFSRQFGVSISETLYQLLYLLWRSCNTNRREKRQEAGNWWAKPVRETRTVCCSSACGTHVHHHVRQYPK